MHAIAAAHARTGVAVKRYRSSVVGPGAGSTEANGRSGRKLAAGTAAGNRLRGSRTMKAMSSRARKRRRHRENYPQGGHLPCGSLKNICRPGLKKRRPSGKDDIMNVVEMVVIVPGRTLRQISCSVSSYPGSGGNWSDGQRREGLFGSSPSHFFAMPSVSAAPAARQRRR